MVDSCVQQGSPKISGLANVPTQSTAISNPGLKVLADQVVANLAIQPHALANHAVGPTQLVLATKSTLKAKRLSSNSKNNDS